MISPLSFKWPMPLIFSPFNQKIISELRLIIFRSGYLMQVKHRRFSGRQTGGGEILFTHPSHHRRIPRG